MIVERKDSKRMVKGGSERRSERERGKEGVK